jgi:hypothetical protein
MMRMTPREVSLYRIYNKTMAEKKKKKIGFQARQPNHRIQTANKVIKQLEQSDKLKEKKMGTSFLDSF